MKFKVKGEVKGELDIKRCDLPGLKIEGNCLNCGAKIREEWDKDAFNYPIAGEINDYYLPCHECDTCNIIKLQFDISVKVKGYGIDS